MGQKLVNRRQYEISYLCCCYACDVHIFAMPTSLPSLT